MSRQMANAAFHKSKTLDNKYVTIHFTYIIIDVYMHVMMIVFTRFGDLGFPCCTCFFPGIDK